MKFDVPYGITRRLPGTELADARTRTTAALQAEGFGVLTEIDVKATMKQKLDVDFRKYTILGACNPPLAHKALMAETKIGVLLPCNLVVFETGPGTSTVAAVDPIVQLGKISGADLAAVAGDVRSRLIRALESVAV